MSRTGKRNVFRPKQNLEQWLPKTGLSHPSMLLPPSWCFCYDLLSLSLFLSLSVSLSVCPLVCVSFLG